jgi:hypothetical protein
MLDSSKPEKPLEKDDRVFLDRIPDLPTRFGLSNVGRVFNIHPGFAVIQIMLLQAPEIPGYVINVNTADIDWNPDEQCWELPFDRVRIPK